jgi:hypothetical protein
MIEFSSTIDLVQLVVSTKSTISQWSLENKYETRWPGTVDGIKRYAVPIDSGLSFIQIS